MRYILIVAYQMYSHTCDMIVMVSEADGAEFDYNVHNSWQVL